jgi:hypothetical protein
MVFHRGTRRVFLISTSPLGAYKLTGFPHQKYEQSLLFNILSQKELFRGTLVSSLKTSENSKATNASAIAVVHY